MLVLLQQRPQRQLDLVARLQPLVDVRQDFHHLLADRLRLGRDLDQDRRQELRYRVLQLFVRVGTAEPQQDTFQQFCGM